MLKLFFFCDAADCTMCVGTFMLRLCFACFVTAHDDARCKSRGYHKVFLKGFDFFYFQLIYFAFIILRNSGQLLIKSVVFCKNFHSRKSCRAEFSAAGHIQRLSGLKGFIRLRESKRDKHNKTIILMSFVNFR